MELASCPRTHPSPSPLKFSLPFPPPSPANVTTSGSRSGVYSPSPFPYHEKLLHTLALSPTVSLSIDFTTVSLSVDFASIFPLPLCLALPLRFDRLSLLHRLAFDEKLPQEAPTQPWLSLSLAKIDPLRLSLSLAPSLSPASLSHSALAVSLSRPDLPSTRSFLTKLPPSPGFSLSPLNFPSILPLPLQPPLSLSSRSLLPDCISLISASNRVVLVLKATRPLSSLIPPFGLSLSYPLIRLSGRPLLPLVKSF